MQLLSTSPVPQHSLKRQLLLWLLMPQLLLWLVGGTLAFRIALSYAEKGIDQSLTQSVRSLARQVKPVGSGLLIDFPKAAQAIIEEDPQDKVSYMVSSPPGQFVLGNAKLPEPPALVLQHLQASAEPQFYQAMIDMPEQETRPLRIAILELPFGEADTPQRMRVQVAKSLAVRDRIARELVVDMIVPLLLLGAVLSVLVYAGIARGLLPLARLQSKLQDQSKVGTQASMENATPTPFSPIALQQAPHEVHSLAGAVNQLLATVQRSVAQEKRFVSDAAHQLRTPLAGLQAQLDLALTESDPQALQERLKKVRTGVERASHLVHQLLALARSEAEVPMQPTDLLQLARSLAQEAAPAAIVAGVDFGFEGEEPTHKEAFVRPANVMLMREALSNLIDNSVRYAGCGASVTMRVRNESSAIVIEVEDNGPGVLPQELTRIFERFYRASEAPGGAGLGLAIVQEIAFRHGGKVLAQALQPQGLRVEIVL